MTKHCGFPNCKNEDIDKNNVCIKHKVKYIPMRKKFDLAEIQKGFERLAKNAPKLIITKSMAKRVQESLF